MYRLQLHALRYARRCFLDADVIADLVYSRFRPSVDKRRMILLLFPPPYQNLEPEEVRCTLIMFVWGWGRGGKKYVYGNRSYRILHIYSRTVHTSTVTDRIVFYIYIVAQSIWINSIQFSINMFIIVTHCYAHQYI